MVKRTKTTKSTEAQSSTATPVAQVETPVVETVMEPVADETFDTPSTQPKKRTRRMVQFSEMVESYRSRMAQMDLSPLKDTWLSDFSLHTHDLSCDPATHHAKVLIELCQEKKIPVRGVVSCNKKNNQYVQRLPDNLLRADEGGTEQVTYIGNANKFVNIDASPYAPTREDAQRVIPPAKYTKEIV